MHSRFSIKTLSMKVEAVLNHTQKNFLINFDLSKILIHVPIYAVGESISGKLCFEYATDNETEPYQVALQLRERIQYFEQENAPIQNIDRGTLWNQLFTIDMIERKRSLPFIIDISKNLSAFSYYGKTVCRR